MRTENKIKVILFFLLCSCNLVASTQNKKDSVTDITPSITLSYLSSNDTIILTANIFDRKEQGTFAIKNAVIDFSASGDKETKFLGQAIADDEGNAILKVGSANGLPKDKDGKTTYSAKFAGKGKFMPAAESFSAKAGRIIVNFSKQDSLSFIIVTATQIDSKGTIIPIQKQKAIVYVPRLFNLLKIGETELDETGTGKVEYPGKLVGDSLGNITVIARIEENDLFGNLQGRSSISWGIPKQYYLAEKPTRELWTPIAPIWMIITLVIMLTGVWAHYIYAVVQLVKIKQLSKKNQNNQL
ncbi:MAG: hypothetical protein NTW10_01370 [Bacteroidetes bacterium]|nr:hypothetical protein [Bacteroidota bacterium]